jgi:hypothetical protein
MKHEFAIATHAVERYLTGDMAAEERDAFEDHYFSCETCADDLRVTARFIESAKSVWHEDAQTPPKLSFLDWLKAKWLSPAVVAMATAAMAFIVFQNAVTIPSLEAPVAVPAVALDLTSRAALPELGPGDPLHFLLAPESPIDTPKLWAELGTEAGSVLRRGTVAAPKPQQPIDVYFPGTLKPGRYIITIRSYRNGRPEQQITKQTFAVTN